MKKFEVKDITEGALFVAAYGILALLTRYLITGVDSMIYYIYPLPIAMFSARKSFKVGLIATIASIAISFIFGNPLFVLILMMPNILAGFILGVCLKKAPKQILVYLIIYIIFLISSFLSVWLFEKINNAGYWDSLINIITPFIVKLTGASDTLINSIIFAVGIVVIIIDALIKEILNVLLFFILVNRLNLAKDLRIGFKIPLRYNWVLGVCFIGIGICAYLSLACYILKSNLTFEILMIVCFTIFMIISIYIFYQVTMFFRIMFPRIPVWCFFFIIIGCFIFAPLALLFGTILNIINFNYIKASL